MREILYTDVFFVFVELAIEYEACSLLACLTGKITIIKTAKDINC